MKIALALQLLQGDSPLENIPLVIKILRLSDYVDFTLDQAFQTLGIDLSVKEKTTSQVLDFNPEAPSQRMVHNTGLQLINLSPIRQILMSVLGSHSPCTFQTLYKFSNAVVTPEICHTAKIKNLISTNLYRLKEHGLVSYDKTYREYSLTELGKSLIEEDWYLDLT
jgi:hypothetical protein